MNDHPCSSSGGSGGASSSSSSNGRRLANDEVELYAVMPLSTCPHLGQVAPVPEAGLDPLHAECTTCETVIENWVCLTCYAVNCGRYVNEHALLHHVDSQHALALSFSDLSVWCYPCEAYIHNPTLHPAKVAAHRAKFGVDPPTA